LLEGTEQIRSNQMSFGSWPLPLSPNHYAVRRS
jgi:hypothetical protein